MTQHTVLHQAAALAAEYLAGLPTRSVAPTPAALERLRPPDRPLPDGRAVPAAVLAELDAVGSPATMATAGGRFFGFVIGGSLPAALAASWLAAAWDQDAGRAVMAPGAAAFEQVALRWLLEALGLPGDCAGGFVTGATMANFTALVAARHAVLQRAGWDVEADGLFGAPPIGVVVGDEVHVSVLKALGLLGLGRTRVTRVPTDPFGRMRADRLPPLDDRTIVCLQAGNVNTGACDPVSDICRATHARGAWVHVDGAFGLWADAAGDRSAAGRRDLLVRRDRVAGAHGDAHQRLVLGHDGAGCGAEPRRDDSHRPGIAVRFSHYAHDLYRRGPLPRPPGAAP